ncbi:hypothetical protein GOP47_0012734 [Adiantum capillus-veneris]|nr:hypothetical protein GOP47_0012734 [Adiantum capillus-veneris]
MEVKACHVQQHHLAIGRQQAGAGARAQPVRSSPTAARRPSSSSSFRSHFLIPSPSLPKRSPFLVSNGTRWTAGQWLDSTAQIEVPVPLSLAWDLWTDRERVNRWMPWIHSIKVLKDRPEFSEWCLKYNAFGQDFEFTWTAKNLQPIRYQKIHWRSVDGLPNRGTVRFYPRSASAVGVQLTISYEVPEVLVPLVSSVSPLVESIMKQDLERFAQIAKEQSLKVPAK